MGGPGERGDPGPRDPRPRLPRWRPVPTFLRGSGDNFGSQGKMGWGGGAESL